MIRRAAALLIVGFVACGTREAKNATRGNVPTEHVYDGDAGAAWEGDRCLTLPSRSAPIDVPNAVMDGDLHEGKHHCYLDLQRPLCVRFPNDADGGTDEVYVRALRLGGNCDSRAEVRFRGSLRGPAEPLRPRSTVDWTVDAQADSLEHASHVVEVDLGDKAAARTDLLESFIVHCWRNASMASPTSMGHLTFDVVVAPTGEVKDVRRRDAAAASDAFQACVVQSLRAPQMFLATDAGAARDLTLRVGFSVAVSPLE